MIYKIKEKIQQRFHPEYVDVLDESGNHHVPKGVISHLKIVIVTEEFRGLRPLNRHRILHELLADEIKELHAISLHLFTKEEWKPIESPKCRGLLKF